MIGRIVPPSLVLLGLSAVAGAQQAPPGLVLVEGGRTKVGTPVKYVEALAAQHKQFANTFAGETPQITVEVGDFYLMPNEVTNEQYAEFVKATGHQPPYYWGEAALDRGRVAFLEEQGRLRKEALDAGKPAPKRKTWDPAAWWAENWKDQEWAVPEDRIDAPVNYVSYDDAQAYARWAGLRLMTEFEFQRAARGDTDRVYPWGDDWDRSKCNSNESQNASSLPVGSYPAGAVNDIHDLAGNVWEWTSSRYTKYDGYKPLKIKAGRETIEALAPFDPTMRVLVSGAYTNQGFACRVGVRMGAEKRQQTEALGFRCAADLVPGRDVAAALIEEEVRLHKLPGDVDFLPERTTILQRWTARAGEAKVPGYQVIEGHERAFFTPVATIDAGSLGELGRMTDENGPVLLGMLSLQHPLMKPELDGGTYFVGWRGEGKLRQQEEEKQPEQTVLASGSRRQESVDFWQVPGFQEDVACFFLYDIEGQPVVAWPAASLEFKRPKSGSLMRFAKFVPPAEPPAEDAPPIIPMDTLSIDVVVDAKSRKALLTTLELKLAPGAMDETWK